MNYNEGKLAVHRNNKRTSLSAELGCYEEHQTKKALLNTLLSGQPMKGNNHSLSNNISKLRNSGKTNVKKPKFQSTERTEIMSSSSQAVHNLKDEVPIILRSNDEIRKLAESSEDCTEKYRPGTSHETDKKLTKTLVLNLNSAVHSVTGFEVGGTCVLNMDIGKFPNGARRISADQVGTSVVPNNSFSFDGVLFGDNIGVSLTKGREIASNQPKVSPYRKPSYLNVLL
jgi:hypothetical protein